MLPEFPHAVRISEYVQPGVSVLRDEPHPWLVGKIPPRTLDDFRSTSERKRRTHTYNDLV